MRVAASRVLLVLATIVCIVAALGAWVDRSLLDTDQFTASSVEVLQDPAVQATTAAYLSDQLIDGPAVAARLREALPPRLAPLAGPLSAGAGELAERTVLRIMRGGRFQKLWEQSTRLAHSQLVAVIEDDEGVQARAGIVFDLRPQLGVLAQRLGVSGAATGDKARVRVLRGDQLDTARKVVNALQTVRWISAALAILLLVAAVATAPDHARGLVNAGIVLVLAGLVLLVVRRVAGNELVSALSDNGASSEATASMWRILTSLLAQIAGTGIVLGVVCVVSGWLAGGSAWAANARRRLAPVVVGHPEIAYAVVLALVVALLAAGLLPAASRPLAVLIYLVLAVAGLVVLRRQMERERPA
ncbi:MAG TPA: hypothetical protein VNT55_17575 [Baekduia sp.]|nr:hypothetical protein [Baekduia sp.]